MKWIINILFESIDGSKDVEYTSDNGRFTIFKADWNPKFWALSDNVIGYYGEYRTKKEAIHAAEIRFKM